MEILLVASDEIYLAPRSYLLAHKKRELNIAIQSPSTKQTTFVFYF
jgi:hypothetical protein